MGGGEGEERGGSRSAQSSTEKSLLLLCRLSGAHVWTCFGVLNPDSTQRQILHRVGRRDTHLEGHGVEVDGEEPVECDGGDVDVEALEVGGEPGQLLPGQVLEDLLVRLRPAQVLVEVVGDEVLLCDGDQAPAVKDDIGEF